MSKIPMGKPNPPISDETDGAIDQMAGATFRHSHADHAKLQTVIDKIHERRPDIRASYQIRPNGAVRITVEAKNPNPVSKEDQARIEEESRVFWAEKASKKDDIPF